MKITMKICLYSIVAIFALFLISGCNTTKGKYFVDSEYIISYASLTNTIKDNSGEVTYGIDISHESDIKLTYLKYKCELYFNNKVIETFEDEVPMNGLYSRFIPLKTKKEYDHAKVVCTGYSDEDPKNFVRLNAMSSSQMKNCAHKNLINAIVESTRTNNKNDYLIINYSSSTAFGNFRFFYENYQKIQTQTLKVCTDCGYFE